MLPSTATPRVPPTSRVVSFTAEPTPAFAGGSDAMIDSVAGATAEPSPNPIRIIAVAITEYGVEASFVAAIANPAAIRVSPAATTSFVPTRRSILGDVTAATTIANANGRVRTPASAPSSP